MPAVATRRIRSVSLDETIRRLQVLVSRFEGRYECPSEVALQAVKFGQMKETAEVARWLSAYKDLLRLKGAKGAGAEAGFRTTNT